VPRSNTPYNNWNGKYKVVVFVEVIIYKRR
jgi:hypothetical protein